MILSGKAWIILKNFSEVDTFPGPGQNPPMRGVSLKKGGRVGVFSTGQALRMEENPVTD